jgi:ElaA protein
MDSISERIFNEMNITWHCKTFNELTNLELYQLLQLRCEVFVVEQNCPFQDLDNKDFKCYHLLGKNKEDELMASYAEASIGRVVTSPKARQYGIGKQLMQKSIEQIETLWGKQNIKIGAQRYLKKFYESFQFVQSSEIYLEDGIEHIEMGLWVLS